MELFIDGRLADMDAACPGVGIRIGGFGDLSGVWQDGIYEEHLDSHDGQKQGTHGRLRTAHGP